ncbi:MAG: GGDEF domain-containing protein [Geminicoccaceae bacterium]|nr:GGDEF domain-containing protein [Geminicoccaceae bacterium]
MSINDPIERAEALGQATIKEMARLGVAPTPDNYLIWYTHVAGRDPVLSQALKDLERSPEPIAPAHCEELYERFFGRARTARLLDDSCQQINDVVSRLLQQVGGLKEDTGQYTVELEGFDANLQSVARADDLHDMVASIMAATQAMQSRVKLLENDCIGASDTIADLQAQLSHAQREANTDPLTQIANRRRLEQRLEEAAHEAVENGDPLSFLLMDIDHFKAFNDTFGHQVGDRVLKLIGSILTSTLKGRDLPARFGGEEFAVILPKTALEGAMRIAEQIRTTVSESKFRLKSSGRTLGQITMSIGCAEYSGSESLARLIERADQALFEAKRSGRNRVCASDGLDAEAAA